MGAVTARRVPVLGLAAFLALTGLALIAVGFARRGNGSDRHAATSATGAPASAGGPGAARTVGPLRLRRAGTWRLPAAVQLPALAPGPGGRVLAAGGLDASDVSVADVV